MPLIGRWRIVEMDLWDRDAIDLVALGFIEFARDETGEFGFIAVRGWMDCRSAGVPIAMAAPRSSSAGTVRTKVIR